MQDLMEFLRGKNLVLIFKRDIDGVSAHNESEQGCLKKKRTKDLAKLLSNSHM